MRAFGFQMQWDQTLMEIVNIDYYGTFRGWTQATSIPVPNGYGIYHAGPLWSEDAAWITFTFHCLGIGRLKLTLSSASGLGILLTPTGWVDPEPFEITVNQFDTVNKVEPAPVGGITAPVHKLEILTPYLALAGLIAAVSAVIIKKRK